MKKNSFILIVVTLLVVTIISFVYSCKDEPLDFTHSKVENQKSAKLETAKQWFRQNESGITFSKSGESIGPDGAYFPSFSGEPSWKYYAVTENENLEVIDVDLTDRINQDFILKNSFKNYKKNHQLKLRRSYTRYVHVKNKKTGEEQGFFMTIVPSPYYARTYSHRMKLNKYLKRDKYLGGYVLFHNFEGKFINGWEYKKGKIVGRVLPNGVSTHPDKRKFSLVKLKAKYIVKPQLYTPIKTKSGDENFYDDSWNDNYDNTTVELNPLEVEGTRNDDWAKDEDPDEGVNLEEEPYERCPFGDCDDDNQEDDPCPYNDCYDDFGGIGNDDNADKIIKDKYFEGSKADCVLKSIERSGGGIRKVIQKFDGKFPVSHLKFSLKSLPTNQGETDYPKDYITKITINKNTLDRPNLSIARTIIHEIIHAEMFRKTLSIANSNGSIDYTKLNKDDFPGIYDYYSRYKYSGSRDEQHEQMAAHYIDFMVNTLKRIDPYQPENVYKSLAWSGLTKTTTWENKSPREKYEILKTINDFNNKGSEPCN